MILLFAAFASPPELPARAHGPSTAAVHVAGSVSGRYATLGADRVVQVWSAEGERLLSVPIDRPDPKWGEGEHVARLHVLPSLQNRGCRTPGEPRPMEAPALSPDGSELLVAGVVSPRGDHIVQAIAVDTGVPRASWLSVNRMRHLGYTSDGAAWLLAGRSVLRLGEEPEFLLSDVRGLQVGPDQVEAFTSMRERVVLDLDGRIVDGDEAFVGRR